MVRMVRMLVMTMERLGSVVAVGGWGVSRRGVGESGRSCGGGSSTSWQRGDGLLVVVSWGDVVSCCCVRAMMLWIVAGVIYRYRYLL